jgi:pimeloyl-ACP methyl ester carboxylesterase
LGAAWSPIQRYWQNPSALNREALRGAFTLEAIRSQYTDGVRDPASIAPESYTLDAALISRLGNADIQLDLFLDYANNVKLYPTFQQYLKTFKPPVLAVWGRHDGFFVPAGAEAFRRDVPNATVQLLDTGHFALETHVEEIATLMRAFLNGARI